MEENVNNCRSYSYFFILIFLSTFFLQSSRNPFCPIKKEKRGPNKTTKLIAIGCIDNSSVAIATIRNNDTIGHYKVGDHINNTIITEIHMNYVSCKNRLGEVNKIVPE